MQTYCLKRGIKGAVVKPSMNIVEHLFRRKYTVYRNGSDPAIKPSSKTTTQNHSVGMMGGAAQSL